MAGLSDRYAHALLALSDESGRLDEYYEQAAVALNTLQIAECRAILEHPHISDAEKRRFLDAVFHGQVDGDLLGLLYLTISKSRERMIVPALTAFMSLCKRRTGKAEAVVVSASELSQNRIDALRELLSRKLNKQVELTAQVDPDLIGGFYVLVEGRLIDRTVRKQLKDMKDSVIRGTPDDSQA